MIIIMNSVLLFILVLGFVSYKFLIKFKFIIKIDLFHFIYFKLLCLILKFFHFMMLLINFIH